MRAVAGHGKDANGMIDVTIDGVRATLLSATLVHNTLEASGLRVNVSAAAHPMSYAKAVCAYRMENGLWFAVMGLAPLAQRLYCGISPAGRYETARAAIEAVCAEGDYKSPWEGV